MALPLNPTNKLTGISHGADAAAVPSATNRKLTFRSPADRSHWDFALSAQGRQGSFQNRSLKVARIVVLVLRIYEYLEGLGL
jgi:hypothetical protein